MLRKSIIVSDLKSSKGVIEKICSSFKIPACLTANKTVVVEPCTLLLRLNTSKRKTRSHRTCMIVCLYSSEGLMWEVELCKETKKLLIRQKHWWNWTDEQNFPTEGIYTCPLAVHWPIKAGEGCGVGATAAVVRVLLCFHRRQHVDKMEPMKPFTLHLVPV